MAAGVFADRGGHSAVGLADLSKRAVGGAAGVGSGYVGVALAGDLPDTLGQAGGRALWLI